MKQVTLNLGLNAKKTRKREFLEQIQPWFTLSDPAMEEAFFDAPLYREFAQFVEFSRLPDESTILRFRHRLEKHMLNGKNLANVYGLTTRIGLLLKTGTVMDATLNVAPTSTKNSDKVRNPKMHTSQKGNQWCFDMKARIGVDIDSRSVRGTSGQSSDSIEIAPLQRGEEALAFCDVGYKRFKSRAAVKTDVTRRVVMHLGKRSALDKYDETHALLKQEEKLKTSVRAKVEHPFLVIKCQFDFVKVRYRSLKRSTLQRLTLFAQFNLWMTRSNLAEVKV